MAKQESLLMAFGILYVNIRVPRRQLHEDFSNEGELWESINFDCQRSQKMGLD